MNTRICVLTSVHPALDGRIFHKQARSLKKAGYDVILIAQHDRDEVVDGVKIIALPKPKNRLLRMLGTWRVFKLALKQKVDVYHLHDPELLIVGMMLKLLTRGGIIYDVHEDYPEVILTKSWLPRFMRSPIAKLFNVFEKRSSTVFDATITATDYICVKFKKAGAVSVKNYPILDDISIDNRCKMHTSERYILVYAGSLGRQYYTKEIIRALGLIDSRYCISLRLLGKFEDLQFQSEIMRLPEFSKVEYLGWCSRDEVMRNLKKAHIGLACDRYVEAISTKLLEYMTIGLPVVASDHPLRKEVVEGSECGVTVDASNPENIARAVEFLLSAPYLMKKMGERGREAAMIKYNWEREAAKLLDVYMKILTKRQRRCAALQE